MVHRPATPARDRTRNLSLALSPLVAALAAALPMQAHTKPVAAAVPVPSVSWRVSGTGGAAPVNKPNTAGGVDQTISQTSARGIYTWQSFNIGDKSSVTFDMAQKGASALNRIGGNAPSQIFGKLSATNGGEIFLINANGILFGKGAQVNTGSLVASALNITDSEYLSGFAQSLANTFDPSLNAAFRYDGTPEDFIDSKNFVRVDPGASIATANGGRVFLFAKKVENAGSISTPGGQTVLAGGGEIYLKLPSAEAGLYAAESNPKVSVLRGFLVEVGAGPADSPEGDAGSAGNLATGVINTPRGNTTLIGMAVNQMGRISATTSVSENGSVILRAQGAAVRGGADSLRATTSGALTLGAGSQITITADTALDSSGKAPTSTDSAGFVASHIDLAGQSVLFDRGAAIVAPGATINVRAETVPSYQASLANAAAPATLVAGSDAARIVLREGVSIDVAGSTGAVESVARHFVTTELLGSNDLKDAPVQKDGLLYRAKVTLDTRQDSAILGSLDSYRDSTQRGIEERLSEGGTVRLRAEGAVLTEAGSRIAVSGGKIRYTEAQIRETLLLGSDGKTYTLTDAPADLVYVGATSLQKSSLVSYDRWGVKLAFGTVSPARTELGYTEGRDAGAVEIAAPVVALQGALAAGSVQGERQQSGQDAQRASNGSLTLGAVYNGGAHFNNDRYLVDDLNTPTVDESGAVLRNFSVGDKSPKVDAGFWSEALEAALPEQSGLAQASLQQAGFDTVAIAATGAVRFGEPGSARYEMADSGRLSLLSLHGDVVLGSSLRSAHGKVEMISKVVGRDPVTLEFLAPGQVRVEDGVSVDLSGAWVNAYGLATGLQTSATGGGSFEASAYGVELGRSSVIDVSGGASASQAGVVSGAAAGSISLADNTELADARTDTLVLGGELRGYSSQATGGVSTGGGRLSLKTREVHIADAAEVDGAAGLWLAPSFFSAGGFGSFSVDGRLALDVAAGTVIAPQRQTWQAPTILPAQVLPPSGTATRDVLLTGLAPGLREGPVNLALASSGDSVDLTQGLLTLNAGASLQAGPQAAVSLSAAHQLVFDGRIESHGGSVALTLTKFSTNSPNFIWLGAGSEIDVSGTALLTPGLTNGLRLGQVLGGGQIKIDAAPPNTEKNPGLASSLVFQQGARLDAQGVSADLDVSERGDGGVRTQRRTLASAGGEISFAGNGQLLLEGDVDLHGGAGAAGGTLAVVLRGGLTDENQLLPPAHELRVTDRLASQSAGLTTATLAPPAGIALSSAVAGDWVAASGAADLSLSSTDALLLADNVQLNLDRKLSLVAGRFAAEAGTDSRLSGASVLISGTALPGASTASGGDAGLRVEARSGLVLDGKIATQGLGQIALVSAGDMRLQGSATVQGGGAYEGSLTTPAELSLSAAQIYPATDTRFTFNADGADVTISGGQPAAAKPLSAGGSLVVHAATITQGGVIRAPMGHLELNASEELRLLAGSETSVSAAGLVLPYGSYASELWTRPGLGAPLGTPPDKQIVLNAASVVSEAGSTLDASGGGRLFATEFVPGKGGSHDILAGGDGSYAIVPGVTGLAPHDPSYAATAASLGRQIEIARAVTLADGSVLPAGNYTLLPARYAMLPGAYLVRPSQAGGTALAAGTAVKGTDGSLLVGARLRDAGTGFGDALTSTWQVMDTATALRHSEIRTYDAGDVFAARATKAGTAAPPLPNDAGTLVVRATRARLEGEGRFSAAVDDAGRALGQGGRAEFVAENIQVDAGNVTADDGVLHLSAANLNRLGAQTVVLGATSAVAGDQAEALPSRTLQTQARSVVLAQGAQALTVPDLLASATDSIVVADNARFAPVAGSAASSTTPVYALQGDGAALRVAAAPGATLQRTAVEREAGRLQVGQGVQFDAGGGSLMLDSTGATTVSASARLDAADIGLAGGLVAVGGSAAKPNQLSLTPALTAQVSLADRLTLRGYQRIELADGAVLGSPALKALVLDTPHLRAAEASQLGAQVVAGDLTLVNTTGVAVNGAELGNGRLALQASTAAGGTGVLHIGGGDIGFNGVGQLALNADTAVASAGQSRLRVRGGLELNAPALVAEQAAAELSLVVGGLLRVDGPEGGVQPASAMGGVFTASADAIEMAGRIVLPTGKISLSGTRGVQLLDGARLLTAGASVKLDTQTVDLAGGEVSVASSSGDIAIAPGVRIDVSGGGSGGAGGSLSLSAPTGELQVGGTWLGTAGAGAQGASLDIDVGRALSPGHIAAKTEGGQFTDAITLRQREGDLVLGAAQTLRAHELSLSADGGALAVWGTLDASGAQGGSVTLTAQGDVALHSGASVLAQATAAGAEGGRVELGSTLGRLRLKEGSRIDLSAGAPDADGNTTEGGRLSLRAAQTDNFEVAIDRLAGTISGAGRIDVQAVRVYEGVQEIVDFDSGIEGQLSTSRMASDASNFIGSRGGHATAIAERLAAGSSDVAELIKVHSEAEVRATSDLTLATFSDWILPSESYFVSAAGGDSRHVGDSSVTLRAAGNLFVKQGIDGGLYASFAPVGIAGGTIQLVAGADLAAASAMATGGSAMDLVVGRTKGVGAPPGLAVRTTAGDISLAASGDIDLQGSGGQVQIYTSGYQVDDEAAVAAAAALGFSPFSIGAGDVSLRAGGAVRGSEVNRLDVFSPRILGVSGTGRQGQAQDFLNPSLITTGWTSTNTAGWSGLASTGGGDIDVVAGADVVNLVALAASSGYYVTDASVDAAAAPEVHRYDGGSVSIQAGRDVVNGAYGAGGETLRVEAGRDLVQRDTTPFPNVDSPGTRLYYENTSVSVAARRDLTLGSVHSRFFTYAPDLGVSTWLTGLDGRAAVDAVASAGSLRLTAYEIEDSAGISQKAMLLPQKVRLAAPFGDVEIGGLIGARLFQQPSDGGRLQVLAGGDLALNARLSINATNSTTVVPTYLDPTQVETLDPGDAAEPVLTDGPQFDQSSRESVQLVAGAGDLSIASSVASARPLRLVAGRDIVLSSADAVVKVQHQPAPDAESAQELSLLQAGRDILFNQGYMTVGGAGDVVVLAGRDIDLGRASATSTSPIPGSGLMAIGNTDNGLLPAESAAITLVAGLRADGVDYSAAVQQGFHALGAAALAARAGDVYALLSSTDGSLPALDSAAAKQFSALDTAGQLAQVRELLGQAAYDRALAGYVRGLQGNAALSDAQALAAFDSQSDARRDAAPGSLLAGQLAAAAPDSRLAFIAQVARQDTPRTAQGLQAWMKLKTGQDLALADAVSAFEALPLERQVSWLNQVLVDEVRSQGRAAAQASGFDAEAAYLRGYQAINTVFALDRPAGQIRLPTTQVKTLQSANLELLAATETQRAVSLGAITMMAPGGDINAGELGSSSQSPNRLGIVTVAGGDIAAVVRDDFLVNQSRVFSLAEGDIMLWASSGDIDAGRGAKTVVGAPAPVLRLDPASGKLVLDTSGSFTGSGIAVLNADSDLDLYAPAGAIDAGEAGIRAQGNVFLGAQVVRGADNLQFGGNVVGAPVSPATVSATANLGNAAALAQAGNSTDDEEERRKRRLARRNLLLEFLGFGRG